MDESASRADERRLLDTTVAAGDGAPSAASCGGGVVTVLLALFECLLVRRAAGGGSGRARLYGRRASPVGHHHGRRRRRAESRSSRRQPRSRAFGWSAGACPRAARPRAAAAASASLVDECRLLDTTEATVGGAASAADRGGGLGSKLPALLERLLVAERPAAAVDMAASRAGERCLPDITVAGRDGTMSAAARGGSVVTELLAPLEWPLGRQAAGGGRGRARSSAAERRLPDTPFPTHSALASCALWRMGF